MFLSLVAELAVSGPCNIPATHGEAMQSELMRQLRAILPGSDQLLHTPDSPYTVSPLMGRFQQARGNLLLESGETYWFHLSALGGEPCRIFMILTEACTSWNLVGKTFLATFTVKRWITRWESSGRATWAGWETPETLLAKAERNLQLHPDRTILRFYSPTAFNRNTGSDWGRALPMPLPEFVFGHLARKLELACPGFGGPACSEAVLRSSVAIGRYDLQTHMLQFDRHGRSRIGFTGYCEFWLDPAAATDVKLWFHVLAAVSVHTGIGGGTSWGMGQARQEDQFVVKKRRNVNFCR